MALQVLNLDQIEVNYACIFFYGRGDLSVVKFVSKAVMDFAIDFLGLLLTSAAFEF